MNSVTWKQQRDRRKVLLIVEGKHEKFNLLTRILETFPEINIEKDNIHIFETNIYILLSKIIEEYGDDWYEQDIDIPYLFGKIKGMIKRESKRDYTDVLLIFDYDRHDSNFSQEGIEKMQKYFSNSEDMGKLYINYPMVESYMDLNGLSDPSFENRVVSSNVQNGDEYKNTVKDTLISKLIGFPIKIKDMLEKNLYLHEKDAGDFLGYILDAKTHNEIDDIIKQFSQDIADKKELRTFIYHLHILIDELGFFESCESYNDYMRFVFKQIVAHNVKKANKIQNDVYSLEENIMKNTFESIDLLKVLMVQNKMSDLESLAKIFVLNTSVFLLPDYNTKLIWDN